MTHNEEPVSSTATMLADDLYKAGAISANERAGLLEIASVDAGKDRAAAEARGRASPFPTTPITDKEPIMNPRTIIASIERNRSIMEAQVEKLGEFSPRLSRTTMASGDTPTNVATLLNETVRGHLQGVADALHAIAEVETAMRSGDASLSASEGKQARPDIIDVEAVVIDRKGVPK